MLQQTDRFSSLRAIASGQAPFPVSSSSAPKPRFWKFEHDGNILGTIVGFNTFPSQLYNREEHTIVVELESGELISAFLNSYLQNAMQIHDAQVGDSILIAFFGKQNGERFNRYQVVVKKDNTINQMRDFLF
jgi:hypothetical protein